MFCWPSVEQLVLKVYVATPEFRVTAVPTGALFTRNWTLPVGVGPGTVTSGLAVVTVKPVTVAVSVTVGLFVGLAVAMVVEAIRLVDEILLLLVPPLQMFVSALHSGVTVVQALARLAMFGLPQPLAR